MKKIIITIGVLIVLGFLGYFIYVNYINKVPKITPEPEKVSVEEYYMYGNHFNIKGTLELSDKSYEDIKLTLYNGEDKDFDIEVDSEDNNTYNGTIEINNNSDSTTYNVNVKDSNNLEIKINNTINKTTKIEKKDVSNSVLLEDITEKEYEDIINKISNNKAFNKIYEDISNSNIEIGDIA